MLASPLPLSQVALECGMCDQPHFCRVFRRIIGINPKAWRRQFPVGPAPDGPVGTEIPVRIAHHEAAVCGRQILIESPPAR